jgi:hypothetical protein
VGASTYHNPVDLHGLLRGWQCNVWTYRVSDCLAQSSVWSPLIHSVPFELSLSFCCEMAPPVPTKNRLYSGQACRRPFLVVAHTVRPERNIFRVPLLCKYSYLRSVSRSCLPLHKSVTTSTVVQRQCMTACLMCPRAGTNAVPGTEALFFLELHSSRYNSWRSCFHYLCFLEMLMKCVRGRV